MNTRRSRNRPVKVQWEAGASRILNLLLALGNDPTPRSISWIAAEIHGYAGAPDAVRKQFERDRALLTDLGIRLTATTKSDDAGQTEKCYRLDHKASYLPEFSFTPGQWAAVHAAEHWALTPNLAEAVHAAVTKLTSAAPADSTDYTAARGTAAPVVGVLPDTTDLTDADVRALHRALDKGLRLRFNYWPRLTAEAQERTVEPWGVAAVDGRLFLTGYDIDREAQRTFRLARIADLELLDQWRRHRVPDRSVRQLVAEGLEAASTTVTARVLFRTPGAAELRARAGDVVEDHAEGKVHSIGPVDRTWFVRTATAYAPEAIVLDPPDVVDEIISRLVRAQELLGRNAEFDNTGEK